MKNTIITIIFSLLALFCFAQVQGQISYQAVVRDGDGQLITNTLVDIHIDLLQGSTNGAAVLSESHQATTNEYGLVNLAIGSVEAGNFELIDWSNGPYYLEVEINGTSIGTTQLLSVPYAMHARTVDTIMEEDPLFANSIAAGISGADTNKWNNSLANEIDPLFSAWDKSSDITITKSQVTDLGNYVETEIDPDFNNWDKSTGISISVSQINDIGSYIAAETDPVFDTSVAAGISETDTSYWNNKVDAETQGLHDVLALDNNAGGQSIKNLSDPVDLQDAATKAYVDALKSIIYQEMLDAGLNSIVRDVDGNVYKTFKIGHQVWMAENLRTTKYNDSITIPNLTVNSWWANSSSPAYCWYNNSSGYGKPYGALYNWSTINTGKLCPEGWHVPSDDEWKELEILLGMATSDTNLSNLRGTNQGSMLGGEAQLWTDGILESDGDFNKSGFQALPNGFRSAFGIFSYLSDHAYFWSSTEYNGTVSWARYIEYNGTGIGRLQFDKKIGMAVRCLRD